MSKNGALWTPAFAGVTTKVENEIAVIELLSRVEVPPRSVHNHRRYVELELFATTAHRPLRPARRAVRR